MNPAGGDGDGFDDNSNPLVNKDPNFLLASFYAGISFFETYGWFILFGSILIMVLWTNFQGSLKKFFGYRKRDYSVTDFMSPDEVEARMRAQDKARQKMQERYDALVQQQAEKLKEREEQKRLMKINDHDAMKSGKSQSGTLEKMGIKTDKDTPVSTIKRKRDSKPLRGNDYNPLTGSSSSRWRSSARNTGGG